MKLWAVSMVRNEADVIEAFVRHTLALVDGLVVLDHDSRDETPAILARLKAEGLPLTLRRAVDPAFLQGSYVTTLVRDCFAQAEVDYVFPLDADEFLRASSREALEAALAALPPGAQGRLEWRSYVPEAFDRPFGPHCLRLRVKEELVQRRKAVIGREFAVNPHAIVSEGNHWVLDLSTGKSEPHATVDPAAVTLAHCPVRSRPQLESKIRNGYQALVAAGGPEAVGGYHWRDLYQDLARGMALSPGLLRVVAANYSAPRGLWLREDQIRLVEDPVALRSANGPAAARSGA